MLTVAGDIADPATADRIVGAALDRFGRIDTLVNNAGVYIVQAVHRLHRRPTTPPSPGSTWPGSSG